MMALSPLEPIVGVADWLCVRLPLSQLFADGEMMVPARWPNARWDDRSVFDDTYWAHGSAASTYCGDELRDTQYSGPCRLVDNGASHHGGSVALADEGFDATGAVAVLNIGHWYSFAGTVVSHARGADHFSYARDGGGGGWKVAKYKPTADLYYLEGSLQLLDAETEWHYERSPRRVHLKTRGDADPNGGAMQLAARVQEYALAATGVSHLSIRGLGFFASTLYVGGEGNAVESDAHNVRFDSLRLVHPSAQKRLLGEPRFSWPTTLARKRGAEASNNTLFNCTFFGSESHPLINTAGSGMTMDNNLIEWCHSAHHQRQPAPTVSVWSRHMLAATPCTMVPSSAFALVSHAPHAPYSSPHPPNSSPSSPKLPDEE